MYPGELKTIHGEEEFLSHIEKGKLRETVDEQGDVCYVKVTHSATDVVASSSSASASRPGGT